MNCNVRHVGFSGVKRMFFIFLGLVLLSLISRFHQPMIPINSTKSYSPQKEDVVKTKNFPQEEVLVSNYSSHFCVGAPWYYHRLRPKKYRTTCRNHCHFKHICYDNRIKKFIYYRSNIDTSRPILFDGQANGLLTIPDDFAYRDHAGFAVSFEVTNASTYPGRRPGIEENLYYILSPAHNYFGENFGILPLVTYILVYENFNLRTLLV